MDGLPPDGQKHLSDLKAAAIAGAKSATVEDAGAQAGKMTASCGTLPRGARKPVKEAVPDVPKGEPSLKTRMLEHDHAVRRWAPVLRGPSDEMWKAGVDVDEERQALDDDAEGRRAIEAGQRGGDGVPRLADKAGAAKDAAAKAAVYGEIVATCGHCHSLGGRVFGPGVPK